MSVAWLAVLHAVFYQKKIKPWYQSEPRSKRIRYQYIGGEPKHWDLSKCLKEYWGYRTDPVKSNLEFLIGMRNKIEHRYCPELDPALYGECQANLTNLEEILVRNFGNSEALTPALGVSLQFSYLRPDEQREAIRKLQRNELKDIRDYIEKFRAGLPSTVLESSKYAMRVFLIPKIVNSPSAADLSMEFVQFDPQDPEESESYQKVVALIKEKQVSVVGAGLMRPSDVVKRVKNRVPFEFNMSTHTAAWKHFEVRPPGNSANPERTKSNLCVYDVLSKTYGYTEEWAEFLCEELTEREAWVRILGREPKVPHGA